MVKLEIDGSQSKTELDNLTRKAQVLQEGLKGLKKGSEEYVAQSREISQVNARMGELREEIGITSLSYNQLNALTRQLSRELNNLVPGTEAFTAKAAELGQVQARLQEVRKDIKAAGEEFGRSTEAFTDFIAVREQLGLLNLPLSQLKGLASQLGTELEDLTPGTEAFISKSKELQEVDARLAEVRADAKGVGDALERATSDMVDFVKLRDEVGTMGLSFGQLKGLASQLGNELDGLTPGTLEFIQKSQQLQQVEARLEAVRKDVRGVTEELDEAGGGIGDFVKKSAAFVGISIGIEAVVDTVKELGAEVVNSAKEMEALRANVNSLTGATGAELDELAIGVAGLAKTFNKEYDEVLLASNALSKQMGISQQESLRLIEQGFLAGADTSGEFLDQLKEYPAQFKAAGLSAEEAISVISQSVTEGVFSDKGADVVKEFGLRIREQTKATKEALEGAFGKQFTSELFAGLNNGSITTTEALRRVSQGLDQTSLTAAQAQTVIADVFGGPGEDAGLDYLKSLQNIGVSIDTLVDKNNAYVQRQRAMLASQKELATAQNELAKEFEGVGTTLDTLRTRAMTAFVTAFTFLIQLIRAAPAFISENRGALLGLAAAIITLNAEQIKLTATTLYNTAVTKGKLLWDEAAALATTKWTAAQRLLNLALAANPIGLVVAAVALLIGGFVTLYERSEKVREVVAGLGSAFTQVAKNIKDAFLLQLGGVADILVGIFTGDVAKIKNGISQLGAGLQKQYLGLGAGVAGAYHQGYQEREQAEHAAADQKQKAREEKQVEAAKKLGQKVAAAAMGASTENLKEREANIKAALALVESGSAEELRLKKKLVETKRDIDLLDDKKTAGDRKVIRAEALRDLHQLDEDWAKKSKEAAEKSAKEKADIEKKISDARIALIPDETERKIALVNAAAEREKVAAKGTAQQIADQQTLIEQNRAAAVEVLRREGEQKAGLAELETRKLYNALIVDEFDRKDGEILIAHEEALLKLDKTDASYNEKVLLLDNAKVDALIANDGKRVAKHQEVADALAAIDRSEALQAAQRGKTQGDLFDTKRDEAAKKARDLQKEELQAKYDAEIANTDLTDDQKRIKKAQLDADMRKVDADYLDWANMTEEQRRDFAFAMTQTYIQDIADLFKISSDKELAKLEKDKTKRLATLDAEYKAGKISKEVYESQKSDIEANYNEKTRIVKKEAAEKEKVANIAQSIIAGVLAVIKAGGPFTPTGALTAIAAGLATAKIIATPIPEFEQGGVFGRASRAVQRSAGQAWRGVKQFATGGRINPVAGVAGVGQRHSGGGIRMVDGATGQHLGEWEKGEAYMILSRDTYANNKDMVDSLIDTSLYRGGAPVRPKPGYFEDGGTFGGTPPAGGSGGSGSDLVRAVERVEAAVREARDAVAALPSRQHIGWDQEDTAHIEDALADRERDRRAGEVR